MEPRPQTSPQGQRDYAPPLWDTDEEFEKEREWTEPEETEYRRRRKRRKRACCNPADFKLWAVERPNQITDAKMERSTPWKERSAPVKGWTYQYCMYGSRSDYVCSGRGKTSYPDARFPDRCWIGDAKYIQDVKKTPFRPNVPDFLKTEIQDKIDCEYDRYGIVSRNPDPPAQTCWNIGLQTLVSQPGPPILYFKGLYKEFDIEGHILYRPIREACMATGTDGTGGDTAPRYDPRNDWWNHDPSEYLPHYTA
jgi:hypothetical protein